MCVSPFGSSFERPALLCLFAAAVTVCQLSACRPGTVAADHRLGESSGRAFLHRVDRSCANLGIGDETVGYALDLNDDDARFLDLTAKLFFGEVTKATYTRTINAFYPGVANSTALECIFSQLP
jgi:hypothetical protein